MIGRGAYAQKQKQKQKQNRTHPLNPIHIRTAIGLRGPSLAVNDAACKSLLVVRSMWRCVDEDEHF
jgi:hypothetical protein